MSATNPATEPAAAAPDAQSSQLDRAALEALQLDSDEITSVRLDGLALTKIVKHCKDAHPASASGALLGMDLGGTLEVSNVFALPNPGRGGDRDDDDDRASRNGKSCALASTRDDSGGGYVAGKMVRFRETTP